MHLVNEDKVHLYHRLRPVLGVHLQIEDILDPAQKGEIKSPGDMVQLVYRKGCYKYFITLSSQNKPAAVSQLHMHGSDLREQDILNNFDSFKTYNINDNNYLQNLGLTSGKCIICNESHGDQIGKAHLIGAPTVEIGRN